MPSRRRLLSTGLAAALFGGAAAAARAQDAALALLPEPDDWRTPRVVPVQPTLAANEIHVDPDRFFLYWTLGFGEAIRYAVGIGRPGLYEPGIFYVGAKKEWPSWTPTPSMIEREPEKYARWADGMPGGPDNPLGARALYLFTPERGDTFLRIHGTNAPETIGTAVSNGCARLLNEHIIDLYDRVPEGAAVYLYPKAGTADYGA
ncbi:L,D-transpeptidase [Rubellimicrobium sp. CFH 75288]|uniref:L,D-transpeptidase n=1 Tax=Rubellimicrobium sp. CFH 75288 TaxID=2697034 RepID=UPI0014135EF5|nr:L,D-transpeptidase [Rubellimicrobium sp. CFH 75288]NAZ37817.1 L,D-transpeptidase family protein [Rubellimicrobium sp. CFH 75288]